MRVLRRTLRDEGIVFAILLLLSPFVHLFFSATDGQSPPFIYNSPSTFLPMLGALVVPLRIWQGNEPQGQSYQAAVPIAPGRLTLIKVAAGWLWLLIGVVIYIIWSIGVTAFEQCIGHHTFTGTHPPLWHWAISFGAASIIYLFVSIAAIGSKYPWRWLMRPFIVYGLAIIIVSIPTLRESQSQFRVMANTFLWNIIHGPQGVATAVWGKQGMPFAVSYTQVDTTFKISATGRIDTTIDGTTEGREGYSTSGGETAGSTNHFTPQDTSWVTVSHRHRTQTHPNTSTWPSSYVLSVWQWLRALLVWLSIGMISVCLVSYYQGKRGNA
jgi:hypothetical protein